MKNLIIAVAVILIAGCSSFAEQYKANPASAQQDMTYRGGAR